MTKQTWTLEEMKDYRDRMISRLKDSASKWMKDECRKAIKLAEAEIARMESEQSK